MHQLVAWFIALIARSNQDREPEWWKDQRRVPIGRGKFVLGFCLTVLCAAEAFAAQLISPYAGAFFVGLFVIGVVRHNARASGHEPEWLMSSIAWAVTWGALGSASLALDWGRWLGYGALAIALIAFFDLPRPVRGHE